MMMMTKMTMSHGFDDDNDDDNVGDDDEDENEPQQCYKTGKVVLQSMGSSNEFPETRLPKPTTRQTTHNGFQKKRCHSSGESPQHARLSQTVSFFGEDSKLSDQQDVRPCSPAPAFLLCSLCRWQDRPHRWPLQVQGRASQVNFP